MLSTSFLRNETTFANHEQALPCLKSWQRVIREYGLKMDLKHDAVEVYRESTGYTTLVSQLKHATPRIVHTYTQRQNPQGQCPETYQLEISADNKTICITLTNEKVLSVWEQYQTSWLPLYEHGPLNPPPHETEPK